MLWEYVFIEITDPNATKDPPIVLGNVYRPPKCSRAELDEFLEEFNNILSVHQYNGRNVYIAGDFNLDMISVNEVPFIADYIDTILSAGYIPTITLPTRLSNKSTLIDNILTNNMGDISASVLCDNISDHQAVVVLTPESIPHTRIKYITIRTNDEQSKLEFRASFQNKDVYNKLNKNLNSDPNNNYEILENAMLETTQQCLPVRVVKFNKRKHKLSPWITFGIIRSINQRNKLYKKLKQTNTDHTNYGDNRITFNRYRNLLRKLINNAKKTYYNKIFDRYRNNLKKTWSVISETLNRTKNVIIPDKMDISGHECSDKRTIVEQFNKFFVTTNEKTNLIEPNVEEASFRNYLTTRVESNFEFHTIGDLTTRQMISNIKPSHSSGYDGITPELLKLINNDISSSITLIINQSLTTGVFPKQLKIAKVTPVYKKGNRNDIKNYRPISVLPIIAKVIETTMSNQLVQYFNHNKLFIPQQYGYKKNCSTELAALEMLDRIIEQLNNKLTPINFYLDLSKAFDSIDHDILAYKLEHYGIHNNSLALLRSYLTNRYQYVQVDSVKSNMLEIKSGVPQGSILGPLLFNIFTNDLVSSSTKFNFIMYADDTTLNSTLESFGSIKDTCQLNIAITNELYKIVKWLDLNKLCLNVAKSKYMIFYMPPKVIPQLHIYIQQNNIDYVENFTFLGLTLDCHLTWNSHINIISAKISRIVGILHKLKYMFPLCILQKLYVSLIVPHFNYGLLAWGTNHDKINKLQKRALRTIHRTTPTAHTTPILKRMNQLKLTDIFKCKLLKLYYKLYRNKLPIYFENFLPDYGTSRYPLRYDGIHMPAANREFCELNAKYQLHLLLRDITHPHNITDRLYPSMNDDLPIDTLILTLSPASFAKHIKRRFRDSYSVICNIANCINNCNS